MDSASLSVATWNVEWRQSNSYDAAVIRNRLLHCEPQIVCITEGYPDFFRGAGHMISAKPDYGYPAADGRRKAMLWSARPWMDTDTIGDGRMPSGRFIAGRTETSIGSINVVGVCVPWRDAHVRNGRRDRLPWQDHLAYLSGLGRILPKLDGPTIVLGDFNQRVPRRYQPEAIHSALLECLGEQLSIATAGLLPPDGASSIDHISHSPELTPVEARTISNINAMGRKVSDHFGVAARFA